MKAVLYFFINLLTITCASFNFEEKLKQEWQQFQIKFNKSYQTPWETSKRREIFKKNFLKIETHNRIKNRKSHTRGLNNFTDWSDEEFLDYLYKYDSFNGKSSYLTLKNNISSSIIPEFVDWRLAAAVTEVKNQGHCGSCWSFSVEIPSFVDWRSKNAVSSVKNQGKCASCWSFSAVAALESHYYLKTGNAVTMSEQNLIDCADAKFTCNGCNWGEFTGAFDYVFQKGLNTEADYPYKGALGTCQQSTPGPIKIQGKSVVNPPTEENLMKAVAEQGPVAVTLDTTDNFQFYTRGIFFDDTCDRSKRTHAVLVVGYGTKNNNNYWILKNSWGANWGEEGFMYFAKDRNNMCGLGLTASFPNF